MDKIKNYDLVIMYYCVHDNPIWTYYVHNKSILIIN